MNCAPFFSTKRIMRSPTANFGAPVISIRKLPMAPPAVFKTNGVAACPLSASRTVKVTALSMCRASPTPTKDAVTAVTTPSNTTSASATSSSKFGGATLVAETSPVWHSNPRQRRMAQVFRNQDRGHWFSGGKYMGKRTFVMARELSFSRRFMVWENERPVF